MYSTALEALELLRGIVSHLDLVGSEDTSVKGLAVKYSNTLDGAVTLSDGLIELNSNEKSWLQCNNATNVRDCTKAISGVALATISYLDPGRFLLEAVGVKLLRNLNTLLHKLGTLLGLEGTNSVGPLVVVLVGHDVLLHLGDIIVVNEGLGGHVDYVDGVVLLALVVTKHLIVLHARLNCCASKVLKVKTHTLLSSLEMGSDVCLDRSNSLTKIIALLHHLPLVDGVGQMNLDYL